MLLLGYCKVCASKFVTFQAIILKALVFEVLIEVIKMFTFFKCLYVGCYDETSYACGLSI